VHNPSRGNDFDLQDDERARKTHFNIAFSAQAFDFQTFLWLIHGKLGILKEIAIAKKELPKFCRTWNFLL